MAAAAITYYLLLVDAAAVVVVVVVVWMVMPSLTALEHVAWELLHGYRASGALKVLHGRRPPWTIMLLVMLGDPQVAVATLAQGGTHHIRH